MKGKKHKPEQIIKKLRETDAMLSAGKTIGHVTQALEVRLVDYLRNRTSNEQIERNVSAYTRPKMTVRTRNTQMAE